jgi:hypothetical protein
VEERAETTAWAARAASPRAPFKAPEIALEAYPEAPHAVAK